MTVHRAIAKLRRLCQSWGGDLRLVTRDEFDARGGFADDGVHRPDGFRGFWQAPFGSGYHGFDYENGILYAAADCADPGAMIHEMGHVFVDRFLTRSDEWQWFGWEIAVAKAVGCHRLWDVQSAGYTVTADKRARLPAVDWGELSRAQKWLVTAERLAHATKRRYLSPDGAPLAWFTRPLAPRMRAVTRERVRRIEERFELDRQSYEDGLRLSLFQEQFFPRHPGALP